MAKLTKAKIKELVDEYGALAAKLSPELEKLEEIKAKLKNNGDGEYEGDFYDANVFSFDRKTIPADLIEAKLGAAWVKRNQKHTPVTVVKVTAKKLPGNVATSDLNAGRSLQ